MDYFLYARKSTDDDRRQVYSIPDQTAVMRQLAKQESLVIVAEFEESRTAKVPGRPIYNDMIRRIKNGGAQGVLAWKLNRIARNMQDGGEVAELLKQGIIQHGGETYHGRHAPIVSKDLFDRAQKVIEPRGRKQKAHKDPASPLSTLAVRHLRLFHHGRGDHET